MLSSSEPLHKQQFPNCSSNTTKIHGNLHCGKCREERRKGIIKRFDNTRSLFYHLMKHHSGMDKESYPKLEDCIEQLQQISNAIVTGVLK